LYACVFVRVRDQLISRKNHRSAELDITMTGSKETCAFRSQKGSSAPQDPGDFHPGGFRNMTVWIACMGLMSETWKTITVCILGSWLYGRWKTEFSYWNVCRITYRPVRTKS
jgi:hypothetical protein